MNTLFSALKKLLCGCDESKSVSQSENDSHPVCEINWDTFFCHFKEIEKSRKWHLILFDDLDNKLKTQSYTKLKFERIGSKTINVVMKETEDPLVIKWVNDNEKIYSKFTAKLYAGKNEVASWKLIRNSLYKGDSLAFAVNPYFTFK